MILLLEAAVKHGWLDKTDCHRSEDCTEEAMRQAEQEALSYADDDDDAFSGAR